jgi:Gamma-glutamyltransferase
MKGAVAAGHALTAEAGARALAEGGNAVDACVAAAFAAWVVESPLTGPGAGGFALVLPGRRAAGAGRRLLRGDAGPRPARPSGAQMHAIDVGFGGDSETTQVFRIGEASSRSPAPRWGSRPCTAPTGACRGRSCCSRRSSSRATASS